MANNEHRQGDSVKTDREILEELRQVRLDLDCTIDEARAVAALRNVHQIHDQITFVVDRFERRWKRLEIYIRSRNSGDKQAVAVYESLMKELEQEEGQRKKK